MHRVPSYTHVHPTAESERLTNQFNDDWAWEKTTLENMGLHINAPERMRILSYGCGVGVDAATLFQEGYAPHVEGWDTSAKAVQKATQCYGHSQLIFRQVDLVHGDAPIDIPGFDFIYLRLVLQHIPALSILKLLEKCKDLLNDGGYLVIHDTDRFKDYITPSSHEFNLILNRVCDYMARCGNNPRIGSMATQLFAELNLKNVQAETIELQANFTKTRSDLSYAENIIDVFRNQQLIPERLWAQACSNEISDFNRTSLRFITVGQK
ncbi:MAG: class I SAM-dependent methyltransferase [Chloroflexota bacterium]